MLLFESSKTFRNYPCSHRRHLHDGACAFVHGYSRSFTFWFRAHERTENGFVVDFGKLKPVEQYLADHFDHTLLLDAADPLLPKFRELEELGACKLVTFDDVGMEGTARFVMERVGLWIEEQTSGRAWLHSVEVRENEKNSARVIVERPSSPSGGET